MPDYDFYVNTYLGTALPEQVFPQLAAKAASVLEGYERHFRVTGSAVERHMAICAMAEALQDYDRRSRHAAASLGKASVRYEKPRQSLEQVLYRSAAIYLDFYRGVQ